MGKTLVNNIPISINAGLTFALNWREPKYAPPTWALHLLLRGPSVIDIASTVDTDGSFLLTKTAAITIDFAAGQYQYSLRATDGTAVNELRAGRIDIRAAIDNMVAGTDVRHPDEITLAAIDALLCNRATSDQARYKIADRELWRSPVPELLKLQAVYRSRVRRLRARERGVTPFGQVIKAVI